MKTFEEALTEYQSLLNDDTDFEHQWCDTLKDFYEWCSNYDDLKHIAKGEQMELILIILVPILYFIYDLIKTRREKQLNERLQKHLFKYYK